MPIATDCLSPKPFVGEWQPEQKLAVRNLPDSFSAQGDAPAWSPDGKVIACPAGSADASGPFMTVLEVRVQMATVDPSLLSAGGAWDRWRGCEKVIKAN